MNHHTIKSLTYELLKNINFTFQALAALGEEVTQIREVMLENWASISRLLLRAPMGARN